MKVSYKHESVRLTGRWDTTDERFAETTTTGAYIEFAFEGKMALAMFDTDTNGNPPLHLWISLDGGNMFEAPIDSYLRVIAKDEGKHICRIVYKGGEEAYSRWYRPLHGKVSFIGFVADKPVAIGEDTRKTIEFVGDSITEGVLIDADYFGNGKPRYDIDQFNRLYQDDVCATYAWLLAERLDLRPIFMGYGAVGATKSGQGLVPRAAKSYPYNFDGSPVTRKSADYIMINHGANDRNASPEKYLECYGELLDVIISLNPDSKIIVLSAFCGAFHEELGSFIADYNAVNGTDISFIDSFGWVPKDPLHPLRPGHTTIADHLTPIVREIIGK